MSEERNNHVQNLQQAIATTITCRSIIKYSSTLSDEQKNEVLAEIESTLAFLHTHLATSAHETNRTAVREQRGYIETADTTEQAPLETPPTDSDPQRLALKNLQKLYHAYLSKEPGKGIVALEIRYKTTMDLLDHIQTTEHNEHLLHRIRGFISAIYSMFREFATLLSHIAEGKMIDVETETLALLPPELYEIGKQQVVHDITPLLQVYRMHLQVQAHKGMLTSCARDATAFLIFLAESLGHNSHRRAELISQLKSVANLFNEMARLLAAYEQAMAEISAL